MAPPLDALADAITERRMRLAVFDMRLRMRTGQWHLTQRVPLGDVIEAFAGREEFIEDGLVRIPLHESDAPALTDEYVLLEPAETPRVRFFDPGRGGITELTLEEFAESYPGWRMRFWSDAFSPEAPSPLVETAENAGPSPTRSTGDVSGRRRPADVEAFYDRVRSAVVSRRERLRAESREAFARTASEEFVGDHGGIVDVESAGRTVDDFGQQVVVLGLPDDHSLAAVPAGELRDRTGLRPGDEVVIDADELPDLPVEAELFRIGSDGLELGIYWDSARGGNPESAFDAESTASFVVGKLVDGGWFDATTTALETVSNAERQRDLYAGAGTITVDERSVDLPAHDLDRYQSGAIERAVAADVCCIECPPWTGSRRSIAALVADAVERDRRVLLLTPDDEALELLLAGGTPEAWGLADRSLGADDAFVRLTGEVTEADVEAADVVATPIARADTVSDHRFELAIVDQAGDIPVAAGAIPFAKASRVVFVGDPMQSPRDRRGDEADLELARSIFEHLGEAYGTEVIAALRCQYRMNQAIAMFPNRTWYDGQLLHGSENRRWTIDAAAPLDARHVPGREQRTPTGSHFNEAEIQAVIEEVRSLRDRGLSAEAIGIVTPYSAQLGKIRVALNDEEPGLGHAVTVADIEQLACRHRDAIIVSTVRTAEPNEWADDGAAFWTDRGLNLALTRASKRLVLIGDWRTMSAREAVHGRDDAFVALARFLEERGLLPELD